MDDPAIAVASIIVIGVGAQWLAWRLHFPSILVLLGCGVLLGPVSGQLHPDAVFGDLLLPVVSVAVAIILFEGGLTLRLTDLRRSGRVVHTLISLGAAVTWAVAAAAGVWILGLEPGMAALLGAILMVTGPTVIGPLLRHVRPVGSVGGVLHWEGILIDPIGAVVAFLTFEAIVSGGPREATSVVVWGVVRTAGVGLGIGLAFALFIVLLLRRYLVPDFLHNAVTLAFAVGAFSWSDSIQHESGFLAVTVLGVALASQKFVPLHHIIEFKEHLRVLLLSGLFVVLAARLTPDDLRLLGWETAVFVGVLIVVARPLSILASTLRSSLNWRERAFLAWMAPRGIVAAAVSSIFALRLAEEGRPGGEMLVPVTFAVIIGTISIYGTTAPWVGRKLRLSERDPQGFLIVGAHAWARSIAKALQAEKVRVLLADTEWTNVSASRLAGFECFYGNVLSDEALEELELTGIGTLLALTPNDEVNALSTQRFAGILGRKNVYQVAPKGTGKSRGALATHLLGRQPFGEGVTHASLEERFARGAVPKGTRISEQFDMNSYRERYGEDALPLFTVPGEGKITIISPDGRKEPKAGEKLIALVVDEDTRPEPSA